MEMGLLRIINSEEITEDTLSQFIPRQIEQFQAVEHIVREIIERVRQEGDESLLKLTKKFDNIDLTDSGIQTLSKEIEEAYKKIDRKLLNALKYAKSNLIKFHLAQKREEWSIPIEKGVKAGQIFRPLERVGLYIPGGRAIYPSTVLMAATPAYVAGVKEIILCSPPQKDGRIAPEILVAANELGIKEIYKVGGAQAIAAMAYGTKTIPRVQKVVGPGNKYVNAAKQILSKIIAIDNPAGPSEILIIADEEANLAYVIVDFISQIEHDPDNIGIIVSASKNFLLQINEKLSSFIDKCERKEIIQKALNNCLLVEAKNLEDCARISNIIAPEHLELLIKNPKEMLPKIRNAGAIFLGPYSPVPLGDYSAGTNHILPTGGNAKTYSGLNVYDFLKMIDILECTREGLSRLSDSSMTMAQFEKLYTHKKSIEERLKDKK